MKRLCDDFVKIAVGRLVCGLVVCCGLGLEDGMAAEEALKAEAETRSMFPWQDKEAWSEEFGVSIGGGLGMKIFGSDLDHHFALSKFHYGWNRKRVYFEETWLRGEFGIFNEIMAGGQFDPEGAYVFGVTPVFRYRLSHWERVRPFLEGAAGMMLTDIGRPSLGSVFEFYQQAGAGVEWQQTDSMTLTAQTRFVHISNAGITRTNRGVNNLFFFLGANWSF